MGVMGAVEKLFNNSLTIKAQDSQKVSVIDTPGSEGPNGFLSVD
jgi:hypothetical protein